MQQSVLSQGSSEISQKTSNRLGNFCVDRTNVDSFLEATVGQVP